ncbi:transcription factor SPEECHLESS-like [Humulus lupulus]|uniref:transcription factor SPEECHLESS-like n=1 Tax=Humulus lupulus TaxID=3486 RepID=UPI002B40112F|nr:transcription factor SPEECHLESS-like [Humulus lupulus]
MSSTTTFSATDVFNQHHHDDLLNLSSGDDLFSILERLEADVVHFPPLDETAGFINNGSKFENDESQSQTTPSTQKSSSSSTLQDSSEAELDTTLPKSKRLKASTTTWEEETTLNPSDGQGKMSHIAVERNRRKQMNENLTVLRSLMPCFYVKRGDQASIIGGVVDYINELQQVLQSLEAKKQRKIYTEVLSPRLVPSPRASPVILSPRKPPLSPHLISLPNSPRTPQSSSPYIPPRLQQTYLNSSPTIPTSTSTTTSNNYTLDPSPTSSSTSSNIDNVNDLFANSKSAVADVEVSFSGSNVLLKTVSPRIPGQAVKIIAALEDLSLEILKVNINTVDETMLNHSFTIKIGVECQLSAEELAHQIQQTFC